MRFVKVKDFKLSPAKEVICLTTWNEKSKYTVL